MNKNTHALVWVVFRRRKHDKKWWCIGAFQFRPDARRLLRAEQFRDPTWKFLIARHTIRRPRWTP